MYELIKLTENNYYIESPAKVGIIHTGGGNIVAIDSGHDKDAGKKIKKIADSGSMTLKAIFNTHYHADHIGGNQYLQKQTGCKIYAPETEAVFVKNPILEPSFLYGGNPPSELKHKFLMAQPSDAQPLTEAVLPDGLEIIELGGHSFNMAGFKTNEGVVFLADSLASEETINKYKIVFLTDVEAYIQTLQKITEMTAKLFVPSHASVTDDIAPLARFNIEKTLETADSIEALCKEPISFEEIMKTVFLKYSLNMSVEQYALIGSTIKSYLTWLVTGKRLEMFVDGNRLLWRKTV